MQFPHFKRTFMSRFDICVRWKRAWMLSDYFYLFSYFFFLMISGKCINWWRKPLNSNTVRAVHCIESLVQSHIGARLHLAMFICYKAVTFVSSSFDNLILLFCSPMTKFPLWRRMRTVQSPKITFCFGWINATLSP